DEKRTASRFSLHRRASRQRGALAAPPGELSFQQNSAARANQGIGGMDLDATTLARVQFAFTIGFHILFPTLTIGLGLFLVGVEALWLKTRNPAYFRLYRLWSKVFALGFGMGVVSGIVLSYQFGTNFSRFSEITGPVLGPLLSYEVLTAFFVEAGFIGVMLFGWRKVGPKFHFLATCLVALGTLNSAFWILAANSWMHTPK